MKININTVKEIPKHIGTGYCVYNTTPEFIEWLAYHGFTSKKEQAYTNFTIPEDYDLTKCFNSKPVYNFIDGFSPNLNKYLHLGHLSNFIIAKSFQSLGIGKSYLANLGDTLTGDVDQKEAYKAFIKLTIKYGYHLDLIFKASKLKIFKEDNILVDGLDEYAGTKVFEIGDEKIVGIKTDGSTSYFYQDVALANILKSPTLYLTGLEQENHFKLLGKLFPGQINHLPLGLVTLNSNKMSSRKGNVIYLTEVLDIFKEQFGDNDNLIWNVLCGYILKSNPSSSKSIHVNDLKNPKLSFGLYLSYTLAKMNSAGLVYKPNDTFHSNKLQMAYLKAKWLLEPNILLMALVDTAKTINGLYEQHMIKDHPENHQYFINLSEDLLSGMFMLGMKEVTKV